MMPNRVLLLIHACLKLATAVLLVLCAHGAWAAAPVTIAKGDTLSLHGYMDFLPDTGDVDHNKLIAGEYDPFFHNYDAPSINFYSGPIWLRVRIANVSQHPSLILSLHDVLFTDAKLFYNRANDGDPVDQVVEQRGLLHGHVKKNWPYYDIAFRLDIPPEQMRTIYVRLETPYILLLDPTVSDELTYNLNQINQASWGHLMVGIMAGVLIYMAVMAVLMRHLREVRYCTAFVVVSFMILLFGRGYLFELLPDINWLKLHLYALLFSAQAFTYVAFSRHHFKTQRDFPHVDKALLGAQYMAGTCFLASTVIPVPWAVICVAAIGFIFVMLLCICSVYIWANSERRLTIYITGTLVFLFACILATCENTGLIDLGGRSRYGYEAGICLQAILFVMALVEKISEYQQEKIQISISAAEAEAENRAKSSFLAKMSHELRTPMNGLLGMLQLLERTPLNDQQQHYMQVMRNSGRMLLGVIDDVLDYSRIIAGKLRLEESDYNLTELMSDIETLFSSAARQKNLDLHFSINTGNPVLVHGDVMRLRQVLVNLVSNAIKFTDQGSVSVRVWVEQSSDAAWLLHGEVEDSGIGIAPEQIDGLFREFSQANGNKSYGGSGLGLVICKQLVDMMSGRIHVESAINYGSVFRFHIAVQPPKGQSRPNPSSPETTVDYLHRAARILVVEDNEINRDVIVSLLSQMGCHAKAVNNGMEAVHLICQQDVAWDLVLMDIEMPVLDGLAATQRIREWEAQEYRNAIPIIALTAHTMRDHEDRVYQAGMDDHLCKPIDMALLQNTISRWLPLRFTA
ncbi:MAG TPA: ATP-binding protein [Pseudomonadales bacterium]|nr:ATP-binding protein [Pseudomonadales bacterium]